MLCERRCDVLRVVLVHRRREGPQRGVWGSLGRVLTTSQLGIGAGVPPHHALPGASRRSILSESQSRMMEA